MNDRIHDDLKRQADELRIEPSDRVWERLENRLDQDKGKIRISVLKKWAAVAACVLLISSVIFINFNIDDHQAAVLVELDDERPEASFASYKYASDINAAYARGDWQQIKEGSIKQLESSQLLQRPHSAPPVEEDTL